MTDLEMINASIKGDKEAFEQIIRIYTPYVYGKALLLTANPHDAEDLTQETFLKAYKKLHKLKDPNKLGPWLLTINKNLVFSKHRQDNKEKQNNFELLNHYKNMQQAPVAELKHQQEELKQALADAIMELPTNFRLPILLHHMEGLSYKEIQEKLNLSHATIKGIISRGMVKLRKSLNVKLDSSKHIV